MATAEVVQLDAARGVRIGGSDAAAAAGVDPYRSRVMLWAEKTGRIARPESDAMRWGKLIEPLIFAELRERGYGVVPSLDADLRDDVRPWLGGTPDGGVIDAEGIALLEVKTSGHWGASAWADGAVPVAYVCQVQHYLHLTGLDRALLAVLLEGQRLELRTLHRDDALIGLLLEREAEFVEYVTADRMPPPDGSDSAREAVRTVFAESDGRTVRFTPEQAAAVRELRRRKEQSAIVARQIAALEQRIQAAMGTAEVAIGPHDEPLARWKPTTARRVDVTAFKAQRPEMAELFTTETTNRRFTLA